jgi:30S ribosomal protein S31
MGKGDKKTAKGKRIMGSYGVTRQKKKNTVIVPVEKTEKPAKEKKEKVVKKETVKKETVKKTTAKKDTPSKSEKK